MRLCTYLFSRSIVITFTQPAAERVHGSQGINAVQRESGTDVPDSGFNEYTWTHGTAPETSGVSEMTEAEEEEYVEAILNTDKEAMDWEDDTIDETYQ